MGKKKSIVSESHVGLDTLIDIAYEEKMKNIMNVKHPTTICEYTQPSTSYEIERKTPLNAIGIDIETDIKTGDVQLIGIHSDKKYGFKERGNKGDAELVSWFAEEVNKTIMEYGKDACYVCWGELDTVAILHMMLRAGKFNEREQLEIMKRWGHVEGVWTKGEGWIADPLISLKLEIKKTPQMELSEDGKWERKMRGIKVEFGILQALGGSITLFMLPEGANQLQRISMFDISKLQKGSLQSVSKQYGFGYEKAPEEFHKVDWKRYSSNKEYKKGVLKSNEDDAMVVRVIANAISLHYSEVFKKWAMGKSGKWEEVRSFPSGFWSTGTLCMFGLSMTMKPKDRESINWGHQLDEWLKKGKHTQEVVANLYMKAVEGYKAGLIESYRLGTLPASKKAWMSDMTSAYPFIMSKLYDLRGSVIREGLGRPNKPDEFTYVLVRCKVDAPFDDGFHSVGVKEPRWEEAMVRPADEFIATGLYQEFELLEKRGATVEWLDWTEIQTTGEPHPLAKVVIKLWNKRDKILKEIKELEALGDTETAKDKQAEADAIKTVMNSIYGKTFEAYRKFEERVVVDEETGEIDGRILLKGFKAGQLFNPLVACLTTGFTRIRLVEKMIEITNNGGKIIQALTDAIYWEGNGTEMAEHSSSSSLLGLYGKGLDENGWSEVKALGHWSKPIQCYDFICLGTGRYQYRTEGGELELKIRGMMLNVVQYVKEATQAEPTYETLEDMLKAAIKHNYRVNSKKSGKVGEPCLRSKQRLLGTPQYCVHFGDTSLLGIIHEKEVDLVITDVFPKRFASKTDLNLETLSERMIQTYAPSRDHFVETTHHDWDGTLPVLREKMAEMGLIVWETSDIRKKRDEEKKKLSSQDAYKELKALCEFFHISQDDFKLWRKSVGGIEVIREEAYSKGFNMPKPSRKGMK